MYNQNYPMQNRPLNSGPAPMSAGAAEPRNSFGGGPSGGMPPPMQNFGQPNPGGILPPYMQSYGQSGPGMGPGMGPGFGRFGGNSGQAQQAQPAYSSPYGAAYGTSAQPTMIATNPLNQPQMNTQQAAMAQAAANQGTLQGYAANVAAMNKDYGNLPAFALSGPSMPQQDTNMQQYMQQIQGQAQPQGLGTPQMPGSGTGGQVPLSQAQAMQFLQQQAGTSPIGGALSYASAPGNAQSLSGGYAPGSPASSQSAMANGGLTALLPAFQRAR